MYIGTVVKILHKGQKVYAVVKEFEGKQAVVVFPYAGLTATVELHQVKLPLTEIRTVNDNQRLPQFVLLRQFVGIKYETPEFNKGDTLTKDDID